MTGAWEPEPDLEVRYTRVWAVVVLLALIGVGVLLTFLGAIVEIEAPTVTYSQSVGASILASVIVYVLVSLFLDPKKNRLQARQLSQYAVSVAHEQFRARFETSLPIATFEDSNIPKASFRDAFVAQLEPSSRYDFKGSGANFTTFRVHTLRRHPAMRRLQDIRLSILDPRDEKAVAAFADQILEQRGQARDSVAVAAAVVEIREDILSNLVALYDISHELSTTVYLHRDLPFYRCESFDNGMFLTYYVGAVNYPETLQFPRQTRQFVAYQESAELSRRYATAVLRFSATGASADRIRDEVMLESNLMDLGGSVDLSALRRRYRDRFGVYERRLQEARLSSTDLF